jgi:hypothetical protein
MNGSPTTHSDQWTLLRENFRKNRLPPTFKKTAKASLLFDFFVQSEPATASRTA